jgi:hypothetical protein
MLVTGYKPGKLIASGGASGWTTAIVRILCRYETTAGQLVGYAAGSGFILDCWPGIVLTARHVVVLPRAIPAQRMSVVVGAPNGAEIEELDALGVAYPVDAGCDVAAVLIPGAAPTLLPLADPFPVDGTQVDGMAHGYISNASTLTSLASRVARAGALLRELDKPSIAGMSGGPVCAAHGSGGAFGIQSRDDHGQGLATAIDFGVLNDCAARAREFFP